MDGEFTDMPPVSKYDEIIESPDDSSGPLTFGIELEFLLPLLKKGASDPNPDEKRPPHIFVGYENIDRQILDTLEGACDIPFRLSSHDIFREPHDNVVLYDKWRLTNDNSVRFRKVRLEEYLWIGKEITSEVMRADEPAVYVKRITDVCHAILQARVHLNETTSVHVHVGRGEESFSLLTMKKFASLIFLVDEMLMKLHHPCRKDSFHCGPFSQTSVLGTLGAPELMEGSRQFNEAQKQQIHQFVPKTSPSVKALQASGSIEELINLMCNVRQPEIYRGSVGFTRFLPAGKTGGNTHTFEFRQMAGCLDPGPIIHWVRVCLALVDFARLSDAKTFKDLLEKILNGGSTFTAFDLLLELKLVEEERYFRSSVEGYKNSLDFYVGESSGGLFVPQSE
ncbi:putative amidoligase enzyme-domain-containing protein [Hypoxylon sp. FL1857]|nr:putative amidoligase enzyme-domain-containing protein [Hypoxylon sp. FL1857]